MTIFVVSVIFLAFCKSSMGAWVANIDYDLDSWMGSLAPLLENKKLSEIVIPGTHNSGSYPISIGSRQTGEMLDLSEFTNGGPINPRLLHLIKTVGPGWAKCQELSIVDQLKMGNRYLDLRVFCDEQTDEYYLEHYFIGSNLTDELMRIAQFLNSHVEEVVILDMRSVQNCSDSLVIRLMEKIGKVFEEKLAHPPSVTDSLPTYGQLVAEGTTVVVALNYSLSKDDGFQGFDWLWDSKAHMIDPFANTVKKEVLRNFITGKISEPRPPRSLFVSQIILTPTLREIVAGLTGSGAADLRTMALDLNKDFLHWIEDLSQHNPNIFITDFADRNLVKKMINMNY